MPNVSGSYGKSDVELRDWFAGQSLGGLCTHAVDSITAPSAETIAKKAYEIADAMLDVTAREQEQRREEASKKFGLIENKDVNANKEKVVQVIVKIESVEVSASYIEQQIIRAKVRKLPEEKLREILLKLKDLSGGVLDVDYSLRHRDEFADELFELRR